MIRQFIILIAFIYFVSNIISCSSIKEWSRETFEPKSEMSEVHTYHLPLPKQHLIYRSDHKAKLVNHICVDFYGDDCQKSSTKVYDLKNKPTRDKLNNYGFACLIGGQRFNICVDKSGFCRTEGHAVCKKWRRKYGVAGKKICKKWEDEITKVKFLDPEKDHDFLLEARVHCKKGY